jgi:hypothetical protein
MTGGDGAREAGQILVAICEIKNALSNKIKIYEFKHVAGQVLVL